MVTNLQYHLETACGETSMRYEITKQFMEDGFLRNQQVIIDTLYFNPRFENREQTTREIQLARLHLVLEVEKLNILTKRFRHA